MVGVGVAIGTGAQADADLGCGARPLGEIDDHPVHGPHNCVTVGDVRATGNRSPEPKPHPGSFTNKLGDPIEILSNCAHCSDVDPYSFCSHA
jgi:hypothetical protein